MLRMEAQQRPCRVHSLNRGRPVKFLYLRMAIKPHGLVLPADRKAGGNSFLVAIHDDVGLRKEKKALRDDRRTREEMLQISTGKQADTC